MAAELIGAIIIGILAGWIAGQIMRGHGFGIVGDLIIGIVGALVGSFTFGFFGVDTNGMLGSLITATIGAVIFLFIAGLIARPAHSK